MSAPLRTVEDFGPTAERHLWRRVSRGQPDECWPWRGRLTPSGYGEFTFTSRGGKAKHIRAHRAVFELTRGPIPPGSQLDHICENRACVNPDHLAPVTPRQNTHRMLTRKTGGRDLRVPDAIWDAAELVAMSAGEDLSDVVIRYLAEYGRGQWSVFDA